MPINNSYNEEAIVAAIADALDNFLHQPYKKSGQFEYQGGNET